MCVFVAPLFVFYSTLSAIVWFCLLYGKKRNDWAEFIAQTAEGSCISCRDGNCFGTFYYGHNDGKLCKSAYN